MGIVREGEDFCCSRGFEGNGQSCGIRYHGSGLGRMLVSVGERGLGSWRLRYSWMDFGGEIGAFHYRAVIFLTAFYLPLPFVFRTVGMQDYVISCLSGQTSPVTFTSSLLADLREQTQDDQLDNLDDEVLVKIRIGKQVEHRVLHIGPH